MEIAAIVLAGGFSQRMGRFKPLLPLGDDCILQRVVRLFQTAGIQNIGVVTGHRGVEIQAAMTAMKVCWVKNPDYAKGMFTSVLAGIRALPPACQAFYIHPADIPLVRAATVQRLIAALTDTPAAILYPTFNSQRGHPTLIRTQLVPQILQWSGIGGLSAFLQCHAADSLELPVADEAILLDLDTPDDYQKMVARLRTALLPTQSECRFLMEKMQKLPSNIIAHSQAVAHLARRLAVAVNKAGLPIQIDLVWAAALLHDIARTARNHAKAGAQLLNRHGFNLLAPIVAAHMDLDVDATGPIDEAQIVHLADKLVAGDQYVDLAQRFARKMEKYGKDPTTIARIVRRRENAMRIQTKVENITAFSMKTIIGQIQVKKLTTW